MTSTKPNRRVFTCKQEILDYLNISEGLFTKFFLSGLPAAKIDGRWYAHADNIDEWFRQITLVSYKNIKPEELKKILSSD